MQVRRIQNKISESRWTQAYVVSIAILIWIIAGLHTTMVIVPGICTLLSTYLMMELNNSNALIRIYSRMVSCSFLVFITMSSFMFPSIRSAIVMLGIVGYYTLAFRCYQDQHAPGWSFYAFFCLGMASVAWVQILYFLPILWIVTRSNLLAMSLRNMAASLLGLILPYWFFAAYLAYKGNAYLLVEHFAQLGSFEQPTNFLALRLSNMIVIGFLFVCALIGIVHFLNQKRNDSIRTRLFFQLFITIDLFALLFLVLQPQHYEPLISILAVTTAPLIAHFFALTHTRITNWTFKILTFIATLITIFNLWTFLHTSL